MFLLFLAIISRIFGLFNKALKQRICIFFFLCQQKCHHHKARHIKKSSHEKILPSPPFLLLVSAHISQRKRQIFVVNFSHNDNKITIRTNFLSSPLTHSHVIYIHLAKTKIDLSWSTYVLWATSLIVYEIVDRGDKK